MTNSSDSIVVRTDGLRKVYGDLLVLDGIDLELPRNQHVAIIGPSGSGKSTLLRLLMTLERPTEGTIEIEGEYLWHERQNGRLVEASGSHTRRVRGKIGMVFQHFNLFPHMTVLRNITEAPRRVLGLSSKEAQTRAEELLELVGLNAKAEAYPGELSGGQKQRVAIARALAMQPRIMLFDEVTSSLDPELVGEVENVLLELATATEMTMIIVTHEMRFAEKIADRVLVFDEGRIVEDDTPDVIFKDPKTERARRFLRAVLERP